MPKVEPTEKAAPTKKAEPKPKPRAAATANAAEVATNEAAPESKPARRGGKVSAVASGSDVQEADGAVPLRPGRQPKGAAEPAADADPSAKRTRRTRGPASA